MSLFAFSFNGYLLMPVNGITVDGFKPARGQKVGISDTPGSPGGYIGAAYPKNVKVPVSGLLKGSTWDDFEAKRDALLAALFTTGVAPLRRRDDRLRLAVMTGVGGLEDDSQAREISARRFELTFEGEPFEREDVTQVSALPASGTATITAGGNAPAQPSLTFVVSAVTGEAGITVANAQGVAFTYWPPATGTYTVDALAGKVTNGDGADMTGYLDCKFPVLVPGDNDFTVGATGSGSFTLTGTIPLTWQDTWY